MKNDKNIIEYRQKHKKCKWCKYYKHIVKEVGVDIYSYDECLLKDKIIYFINAYRMCKYYELKRK